MDLTILGGRLYSEFLAPDSGANTGGDNGTTGNPPATNGGQVEGQASTDTTQNPPPQAEKKFTQDDVNRIAAQERTNTEARIKRQMEEKAAQENGEWERLAKDRETELTTVKPQVETLTERVKTLEQTLDSHLTTRVKALPESIRDLRPDGDLLAQLAWLEKAEKAAATFVSNRTGGTPPGPNGNGGTGTMPALDDIKAMKRANGDYRL